LEFQICKSFSLTLNGTTPTQFTMMTIPQPNNFANGALTVFDPAPGVILGKDVNAVGPINFSLEPASWTLLGLAAVMPLGMKRKSAAQF
jgi:hypothetical protein